MNEEPKSIWKKSWTGRQGLLLWLISLTVLAFVLFLSIGLVVGRTNPVGVAALISLAVPSGPCLLVTFVRWVWCWRNFRRFLFGLACLVTLVALFYAEENWRGKHAWEKYKQQWEAKGEHFDCPG